MQHLQTVFHAAAALCAFMEKAGFLGIVDEVVEQVRGSKGIVGQLRGFSHAWRHAYGRSIDDDGVLCEEFGRQFGISDDRHAICVHRKRSSRATAHISDLQTQATQPDHDGFRCAARAYTNALR